MATAFGGGSAYATSWFLDPLPAAVAPLCPVEPPSEPEIEAESPAEEPALLAAVCATLAGNPNGMTLPELRAALNEPAAALREALAAGLRSRRLRRIGAHNRLRYVPNL